MNPETRQKIIDSLYSLAEEPGDTPALRNWKTIFIGAMFFGAPVLLVWAYIYFILSEVTVSIILMFYAVVILILIPLLRLRKIRFTYAMNILLGTNVLSGFLGTLAIGGIANSGGLFLYIMLAPFAVVTIYARKFIGWFITSLLLVILEAVLQPWLRTENNIPLAYSTWFWVLNFLTLFGIVFASIIGILRHLNMTLSLLHQEQEKSENLLLNVLPREVALVLKNETRIIADYIDQASILFADIVSFTPMSASMTPEELVSLLNEVFSQIDTLVDQYGLEKIKTIGDCYMAAAGVPRPRPDHAHALAQLALDIQDYVEHTQVQGRQLHFRIGINSGPVVAGVIGHKKFAYDLWGDAVNTASRMESHGAEGVIQVTRSTYELIQDEFICEPQGQVVIKGKGEMAVWRVVGKTTDDR